MNAPIEAAEAGKLEASRYRIALMEIGKLSFSDHSNKTLLRITEIAAAALYPPNEAGRLALNPRGDGGE